MSRMMDAIFNVTTPTIRKEWQDQMKECTYRVLCVKVICSMDNDLTRKGRLGFILLRGCATGRPCFYGQR